MNQTIQTLPRSGALVIADTAKHSCMELEVCQQRKPPCVGCTVHQYPQPSHAPIRFAPGVIERLPRLRKPGSRDLKAWTAISALLAVLTLIVCLVAGYALAKMGWV